jgi:hypothetical protein
MRTESAGELVRDPLEWSSILELPDLESIGDETREGFD